MWHTAVGLFFFFFLGVLAVAEKKNPKKQKKSASAGASRRVCVHVQAVSRVRPSILQETPVREAEELILQVLFRSSPNMVCWFSSKKVWGLQVCDSQWTTFPKFPP